MVGTTRSKVFFSPCNKLGGWSGKNDFCLRCHWVTHPGGHYVMLHTSLVFRWTHFRLCCAQTTDDVPAKVVFVDPWWVLEGHWYQSGVVRPVQDPFSDCQCAHKAFTEEIKRRHTWALLTSQKRLMMLQLKYFFLNLNPGGGGTGDAKTEW